MGARLREHIRSNVVGYVAVFLALSGGAYAIEGRNTVDSGDIARGQVKRSDVAKNAINSPKVAADSMTGADIVEGSLGQVPSASTAGSAANADTLDGVDSGGFLRVDSGTTIRGSWRINYSGGSGGQIRIAESFPVTSGGNIASVEVNFTPGSPQTDDDPSCDGTIGTPTAPPGKVCLYVSFDGGNVASITGDGDITNVSFLDFTILATASNAANPFAIAGTWAYTVP